VKSTVVIAGNRKFTIAELAALGFKMAGRRKLDRGVAQVNGEWQAGTKREVPPASSMSEFEGKTYARTELFRV
jgi:hypothetical protein